MRVPVLLVTALSTLLFAGDLRATETESSSAVASDGATVVADWIARSADNICGLSDVRTLSNPAKVDHAKALKATPEMKRLKKDGIDPSSAEGIQLKTQAVDRVLRACKGVMAEKAHCSVWKKIKHKDGRKIADITVAVLAKL